jgi:hypothetical protein
VTIHIHVHLDGTRYVVEAPRGSRVVHACDGDCLILRRRGRFEYLLTPLVVLFAERREKGLRVVSEAPVT